MTKQRTTWKKQGQVTPTVPFNDATVDYDSSTTPFGGSGQSAASIIKPRRTWTKANKVRTNFTKNPASDQNMYTYNDASIAYNSSRTYNGIVAGEPASTTKKPTAWSKA